MTGARRKLVAVCPTGIRSGAENVLVDYLIAAQETWDVVCLAPNGDLAERLASVGVSRIQIPELKLADGNRNLAAAKMSGNWVRAVPILRRAAADADVVVVNGLMALPAVRLARLSAFVCWLVHDVVVRSDLDAVVRSGAAAVDLAIGVSEAASERARQLGIPTTVSWNGVDVAPHPARPDANEPPIVGISAVLTHWKGQHVLLQAVSMLPDHVVVEMLGGTLPKDDDYAANLQAEIDRAGWNDRVRLLGHVDDPLAVMSRWTIGVLASVEPEAGPLGLLEKMGSGLAVIATDLGGTPEELADAGLLVPPNDPVKLAAAINRILDDERLRIELGCQARQRVQSTFTKQHAAARFLGHLDAMTAGRWS